MSALGLEVSELGGYLDKVTATGAAASANGQQMLEAYMEAGGKLKDMNADMSESAAIIGVMANRGLKGSEAGHSLNTILMRMTASSGESAKAMEALGISAFDAQGNWHPLEAIFMDIQDALSGMTEEQQAYYKDMIAGKNQSAAFSAIMSGVAEEYSDLKAEIQAADGALLEQAGIMNDTMQGAFARLSSATDDLKIQIIKNFEGDITGAIDWAAANIPKATEKIVAGIQWLKTRAGPAIKEFAGAAKEKLTPTFEWIQIYAVPALKTLAETAMNFASYIVENWSTIGPIIAGVASGFAAFQGITKVISIVGKLKTAFTTFKAAGGVVGALGKITAILAGPAGIAIAIGAVVAAGILLYKNWDKITAHFPALGKAVEALKTSFQGVFDGLKTTFGGIVDFVAGIFTGDLDRAIGGVKAIFGGGLDIISGLADGFYSLLAAKFPALSGVFESAKASIQNIFEGLKTTFGGIIDFITGVFTGNWQQAWEGVKNIFGGIFSSLSALVKAPINAVISLINSAIGGINSISVTVPDWVPFAGGKTLDFAIPEIPLLAKGGIATAPTLAMVGEGRENEAILPLSKLQAFVDNQLDTTPIATLLQRFLSSNPENSSSSPQFVFAPNIVFEGPVNENEIRSIFDEEYEKFKQCINRWLHERDRKGLTR